MILDSLGRVRRRDRPQHELPRGSRLVGNVIDLGTPNGGTNVSTSTVFRDPGNGSDLFLVIQIDTAVTSAGSATVSFVLASDAQAAIAVDGSASQHFASAAIAKATLVAGYTVAVVQLPMDGGVPYERYIGILQNVGTAALTAGKFNAFLTRTPEVWKAYTDGV
jgi:hypothetical protein